MKAERLSRAAVSAEAIDGVVVVGDVRDATGRVVIDRGTRLAREDCARLLALPWTGLHVLRLEPGDLGEADAGTRLARAASGDGTTVGEPSGGHWPITATRRGVLEVGEGGLRSVNAVEGLAVYTLPAGQVVDAGEVVARAKILPFAVSGSAMRSGEDAAAGGVVRVLPFHGRRVAALVLESLGATALERFRRSLTEKVSWFGGSVTAMASVAPLAAPVADALRAARSSGADLLVLAGARAMDPLDPAFEGLQAAGGQVARVGVPAHPGSLLWLARIGDAPVVGMPSCGLFSRATVFDVVLARLMTDLPVDAAWLASLGHGGLLTRDMAWRFPPYRPRQDRGAVD